MLWPSERLKKPSPWIARSVTLPVGCRSPCVWKLSMPAIATPRPTCAALTPPWVAVGATAPRSVWLSTSSKSMRPALKPVVLTLAMLLATVSMNVWWFLSAVTAANIDRIIELWFLRHASDACLRWAAAVGGRPELPSRVQLRSTRASVRLTDDDAVDVGEYVLLRAVAVHCSDDRLVLNAHDERQVVQQDQRVFAALLLGPSDRALQPVDRARPQVHVGL